MTWANIKTRMDNVRETLVTRGRMGPRIKASLISLDQTSKLLRVLSNGHFITSVVDAI